MEVRAIKRLLRDTKGATLIWTLCLMVVIFVIGVSVLTAASMATGVATQYRDSKSCYYYTKAIAKMLSKDITEFSNVPGDPWLQIAQSVYDAKSTDNSKKIVVNDVALDITVPSASNVLDKISDTEVTITINNPRMTMRQVYVPPQPGFGSPGDDGYEPPIEEKLERTKIQFEMVIRLHSKLNAQEYVVYLKYTFDGTTLGVPGAGAGSGLIEDGGLYSFGGSFDNL